MSRNYKHQRANTPHAHTRITVTVSFLAWWYSDIDNGSFVNCRSYF